MHDFCPDIAELRDSFMHCLKSKHEGSLVRAWKRTLDSNKAGRASKDEFVAAMAALGWEGDATRMYHLLDFDGSGFLTLEEIDEEACDGFVILTFFVVIELEAFL